MFIAFDGIDGVGKSTQVEILGCNLKKKGKKIKINDMGEEGFFNQIFQGIKKKELFCSPEIREMLYYFEGVMFGEKIKYQEKKQMGIIEIVDRYILSFLSYGPLNGVEPKIINRVISGMPWPDIYFYIDASPEETLERIKKYRSIELPEIGCKNALSDNEILNYQGFLKHQAKVRKNYISAIKSLQKIGKEVFILDGKLAIRDMEQIIMSEVMDRMNGK